MTSNLRHRRSSASPIRWLAAALVVATVAGPVSSEEPLTKYQRDRELLIPFQLSPEDGPSPTLVRLFASKDGGRNWDQVATRKPDSRLFRLRADEEGEYSFCVRVEGSDGKLRPSGPFRAELKVVVDATNPAVQTSLQRAGNGRWHVWVDTRDVDVAEGDLELRYRDPRRTVEWIRVDLGRPREARTGGLRVRTTYPVSLAPGAELRAVVRDRAGNTGESLRTIARPSTGDRDPIRLVEADSTEGGPRVVQLVAPGATNLTAPDESRDARFTPEEPETRVPQRLVPPQLEDAPVAPAIEHDVLLRAARNAVHLENLDAAIPRFQQYLRAVPDDFEVRREFAGVLLQADRLDEAESEFGRIVETAPEDALSRSELARLLARRKKPEAALPHFQWLVEHSPVHADHAADLVRQYLVLGRHREASNVFERYLRDPYQDLAPETRRSIGWLLIDLGRPVEAYGHFSRLRREDPTDADLVGDTVLAAVLGAPREVALSEIHELEGYDPGDVELRMRLADELSVRGYDAYALQIYGQVLRAVPEEPGALLGTARSYVRLDDVESALGMIDTVPVPARGDRHDLTRAEILRALGEYAEAIAIHRRRLAERPLDIDTRIELAHTLRLNNRFVEAEGEFRKVLQIDPHDTRARIGLAQNFASQRMFPDAIRELSAMLERSASDVSLVEVLVETHIDARSPGEGEALVRRARAGLALGPRDDARMKVALGRCLLETGRALEAVPEFEAAYAADPSNEAARYWLYRAHLALGNAARAEEWINRGLSPITPAAGQRLRIARLAVRDCDVPLAKRMLESVIAASPQHTVAQLSLAEAKSSCRCNDCDVCNSAAGLFGDVLARSATNTRARLGLARDLARRNKRRAAIREYDILIRQQPDNPLLKREYARLLAGQHGFDAAAAVYRDAELGNDTRDVVRAAHVAGGDPLVLELHAIDYTGRDRTGTALATESNAHRLRGWRNIAALSAFEGLAALEPHNTNALFEIGQTQAILGRTIDAMGTYDRLLGVDPCHREAAIARRRFALERRPQLRATFLYDDRDGFDSLVDVRSVGFSTVARLPFRDADEYVDVGYRFLRYDFPNDRPLDNNTLVLGAQVQPRRNLWLFGNVDVEEYEYGLMTRPTFDAGVRWRSCCDTTFTGAMYLENLLENSETVRRDIFRWGTRLEASHSITRRWDIGGLYRLGVYSDDNRSHELHARTSYLLITAPGRLSGVLEYNVRFFRDSTFPTPIGGNFNGVIHPYFSPDSFAFGNIGLEWKRYLGRDTFEGANRTWYSVYTGGRVDSRSEAYWFLRARGEHDLRNWFSIGASAEVLRSSVYDASTILAYGVIRFP